MKKSEFIELRHMFAHLCRFCGVAKVWPYGNASLLHSCRECSRTDDFRERFDYVEARINENQKYSRLINLEHEELTREFYREQRRKNNVFEPLIKCRECKSEKPLFEFPPGWLNKISDLKHMECYACISFRRYTKMCPHCRERKEQEDFTEGEWVYGSCEACRKEAKERAEKRKERYLTVVSENQCRAALHYRKMDPTTENIEMIKQLLLAKRINKEAKSIIYDKEREERNESSNENVYG